MCEAVQIEVASKLAIDAHEQVAVERRGDTERIVVGQQQIALRLNQIGAKKESAAFRRRRTAVLCRIDDGDDEAEQEERIPAGIHIHGPGW